MPLLGAGERLLEKELLCREFPVLAALPLDRNSYDSTPLQPRLRYLLAQWMWSRLELIRGPGARRRRERRYYDRLSDFDGPEWLAVRAAVEGLRGKATGVLQPGPNTKLKGATGAKMLLVFLLWASEHT